jgi:phage shock protein PspC (stress-responsive transcriptional regulator)
MTTTDTFGGSPAGSSTSSTRVLRRNRTNRVAAGVSSGLGDYFGVDPVLFRVLFATAAFFGGAGILAYLLAWAAIPEAGTQHAPIDGFIAWVRKRRVPMWLAAVAAGLFLWAIAFSWWAPGPFFPVIAVVVLLVVIFTRREMQATTTPTPTPTSGPVPGAPAAGTVDLTKTAAVPADGQPTWVGDSRSWFDEARAASRRRRSRSLPIRIAMIVTLAVTLTVLGIIDAASGIELQVYFWTVLGIVGLGLLVGLVTRRTPLSMTPLLLLAGAGAIAFAGSDASLHDGVGQREWQPTTTPAAEYRLAVGQGVLDLRHLAPQSGPHTIAVTMGAGQVRIISAADQNVTVVANIHIGQLDVDGLSTRDGGIGLSRIVDPPATARGAPITVDVHLADGKVSVEQRG